MDRIVEFHPAAVEESETAREWYAERSLIAARAFVSELNHAVTQVTEAPERWSHYIGDTRRYIFPRFPLSLIYRIVDDTIQIIASRTEDGNQDIGKIDRKHKPVYFTSRKFVYPGFSGIFLNKNTRACYK